MCLFVTVFLLYIRLHYIEYLVGLIGRHKLDPVSVFDLIEVMQELKRHGIQVPDRSPNDTDEVYRVKCSKVGESWIIFIRENNNREKFIL